MSTMMTPPPATLPLEASRGLRWGDILSKLGPLIGLAFVFALFTILVQIFAPDSRFATPDNIALILRLTSVVGIAALGMTLIIISGGIDLSVGATIALTTVIIADLLKLNCPIWISALGGMAAAAVCGVVVGLLVSQVGLSPFIATLGMWGAVRGAAKGFADSKRIGIGPEVEGTWFGNLLRLPEGQEWMLLPAGAWLMIMLAVLVALMLRYTRLGRHIFAIGSNEQTARLCGVSIKSSKVLIYLIAGLFAGLAGVLEASWINAGDPTTREGAELDVIAAVVIGGASLSGGQGSVLGSLIGALIMTTVDNGCQKLGLATWVRQIATGGIIVLAVSLDRLRQRRT